MATIMDKFKTAAISTEFMNVKASQVVKAKGNLKRNTMFRWSVFSNTCLLAILLFFFNRAKARLQSRRP